MDSRTQSQQSGKPDKQELVRKLAGYRTTLRVPDTRQMLNQSKNLLNVASRLPSTMHARPARTLMITAGVSCLLVLLLKPKRRHKKEKAMSESKTVPRQLLAFSLSVTQPLARVWLTERARRWLRK
jgi:hypothetical protein